MEEKKTILFAHSGGPQGQPGLGSYDFVEQLRQDLGDDYRILCPIIENTENPTYAMWKDLFDRELKGVRRNVILVGHSFGGSMCLKYLSEESPDAHIESVHIVSAPFWEAPGWEVEDYKLLTGWEQRVKRYDVYLYHMQDDPFVPVNHLKIYRNHLPHARTNLMAGDDHVFKHGLPGLVHDIRKLT